MLHICVSGVWVFILIINVLIFLRGWGLPMKVGGVSVEVVKRGLAMGTWSKVQNKREPSTRHSKVVLVASSSKA